MAHIPPLDKNQLKDSIRDLIESSEDLLCIKYPLRPLTPIIQTGKK
ncbi:hypothetical protein COLO4_12301 [Corchorus olitorius]|uniref:Uncharacterized protein n=1 Tax=Corchorus olitorius TaxID=93759 RepID=A0A1R3K1C5_9ROSI|nr:hypothetical protein COLO4_12301 [Corchorus olitorius]